METDIEKPKMIKKGYEFLRELCAFNADFNAFGSGKGRYGRENPITNRVQYIIHQLDANKIAYTVDKFQAIAGVPDFDEATTNAFVNIVVEIEGKNKEITTVFLAHHDVANMASENCSDNSASIANLIDLSIQLSNEKPKNNIVIAFVDAEEIVNPTICGSQRLAQNILGGKYGHVKYAINLELSANGQNYWMSFNNPANLLGQHIREIQPKTHQVRTPYNDGFILEREGIPSVCVGSLNDGNLNAVKTTGYCKTWAECHKMADTFDSQANEIDMDLFVSYLKTLI